MSKSLKDRIKELDEYRPDISYKDGAFILKIRFKKGWSIIIPKDERIAYSADENVSGLHWFVSDIDDSDMIFDIIYEIIAVNKEMEKKLLLYKEKVKVLQELFLSDTPYETLKTLEFSFPKKKNKLSKKNDKILNAVETIELEKTQNEPQKYEDANYSTKPCDGIIIGSDSAEITTNEISEIDKKVAEALK